MDSATLIIHTDGGSRGNPGLAAGAAVFYYQDAEVDRVSAYLGVQTNNVAEYSAVILALERCLTLDANSNHSPASYWSSVKRICFRLDSLLVKQQLTGVFKIKDVRMKSLAESVRGLISKLSKPVTFEYVPREKNRAADALVNETLDNHRQ